MDWIADPWNGAWALTSENWAAIGTWAAVGVAVVAAVFALRQVREARITRDEQAQPNVVMYTEPMKGDWQFLELVVKNFGQTPAYEVEIHLDKTPEVSPDYPGAEITKVAIPSRIPILAPGQEWRALWDHAPSRSSVEGIESLHKGKLTYRGERKKRQHWYAPWHKDFDRFAVPVELDFNLLKDTRRVDMKTIHDVAKTLDKRLNDAVNILGNTSRTLEGYSANEHSGIWVYTADPSDERSYREEQARVRAEESRRTKEWADSLFRRGSESPDPEVSTEDSPPSDPESEPEPPQDA